MSKKVWQYKVYEMLKDSVKIYYIINQIKLVLFNDYAFYKIKANSEMTIFLKLLA